MNTLYPMNIDFVNTNGACIMESITLLGWLITIISTVAWGVVVWSVRDAWKLLADMRRSLTIEHEFEKYASVKKSELYSVDISHDL